MPGSGSTGSGHFSCFGASRIRRTRAGTPPTTALAGTSLVTTELVPTTELSPTLTPRRIAGAVTDPDVRADDHVFHVDALLADRLLDLDHAVVEVDEHGPVGDHAFGPDPDAAVGGDRAFLAEDGLGADLDFALVAADLGAVTDPDRAAELDPGLRLRSGAGGHGRRRPGRRSASAVPSGSAPVARGSARKAGRTWA